MGDAAADVRGGHRDRIRHGVSFEQWAFVLAGLGDGLALEELLAHLRLDEARWEAASEAFQEDVLDDVEGGGELTEALDEAMRAARRSWTRAIPPLDTELRSWLDFYRAWAGAESPMEFLEVRGLRATDIHRLQEHWSERLAADAALRHDAFAILQAPPGPVPTPQPEPPRLGGPAIPQKEAHDVTGAAARGARAALPFADGEPAAAHPWLSVPLPLSAKVARRIGADETRVAVPADADVLVLPFLAPEAAAAVPLPTASEPDRVPEPREDGSERVPLSIERYAALCVDLIEAPDAHEPILLRYGITAAEKLALDVHWTRRMAEDVTTWLQWDRACAEHRAGRSP